MGRENNNLQIWGNKDSMNLNSMVLTNIQSSTYFKTQLYELKTYHEVIDEIYYRVKHLEPWEKGSRRTQGLTGMCGGVRGVGGGGIVSTAFCLLYKLYTLKLTRKQVIGLIHHKDSPYIRALGFMYIRYTQDPQDLFSWYSDYLDDEEELDVKAGGGMTMTIGQMLRQWLIRLEWFDTLFPRIPIPIQKEIMDSLRFRYGSRFDIDGNPPNAANGRVPGAAATVVGAGKRSPPPEIVEALRSRSRSRSVDESRGRNRSRSRSRSRNKHAKKRSHSRSRSRSRSSRHKRDERHRSSKSPSKKRHHRSKSRSKSNDSSSETKRHRHRHHHRRHKHHKHHRHDKAARDESGDEREGERQQQ